MKSIHAIIILSFVLVGCGQKSEVEAMPSNQSADELLTKVYKGQGCTKKVRTIQEIQRDRERGEPSCKKD